MSTLAQIWAFRELLRSLIVRNLKIKYQRSVLGFIWTLLNPLLMVGILALVFGHVVKIQMPHYLAFLVSGYFVWNYLIQIMSAGTYVLAEHAQLARSVAFPKEVPVLAAVASKGVEFLVELSLVLSALAVYHHGRIPASYGWLALLLVIQVVLALGLIFPIAVLSLFYRDVQHALPIVLTSLFYISPVFYPVAMVPHKLHPLYRLNPIAQLMTAYQRVVYEGLAPDRVQLCWLVVTAGIFFGVGYAIFNRYKTTVAEII